TAGQAAKEVRISSRSDPIPATATDVGDASGNPRFVRFPSVESIRPGNTENFACRFSGVNFQFVMANELPNAYDFFMIVCGPVPLSARMAVPDAALDVATGDSGVRDRAWKRIEAATTATASAADLSKLEPSARRSG